MSGTYPFDASTFDMIVHRSLTLTGILAVASVFFPIRFLFRKSLRSEQKKLGRYRWYLAAIVVSCLLWDIHVSFLMAPFPLLPHISFWADGILVYIHPRLIVFLLAFALFVIYISATTLLVTFLYRLYVVAEQRKKTYIRFLGYGVIGSIVINASISCGILMITYPSDERIECFLRQNQSEMLFLYEKPAFIYFTKMDKFIYAQIGMSHLVAAVAFYSFLFVYVNISVHLTFRKLRHVMSANTMTMHKSLLKALVAQTACLFSAVSVPFLFGAAAIAIGSKATTNAAAYKIGGHIALIISCLQSPLNTISMILFVGPFRRYVFGENSTNPSGPRTMSSGPNQTNNSSRAF